MTEDEIQAALAPLPERIQVAYLAGCVGHVHPACGTNGTSDSTEVARVSDELDASLDEDSGTALVHVASAAELVTKSLAGPNGVVVQVLNNIEAAIDVVDPEADQGIAEERQWQEEALRIVQATSEPALRRDLFAGISADVPDWQQRMENG
jgi:hypothetical protein